MNAPGAKLKSVNGAEPAESGALAPPDGCVKLSHCANCVFAEPAHPGIWGLTRPA